VPADLHIRYDATANQDLPDESAAADNGTAAQRLDGVEVLIAPRIPILPRF
jgi:hypothetical protein